MGLLDSIVRSATRRAVKSAVRSATRSVTKSASKGPLGAIGGSVTNAVGEAVGNVVAGAVATAVAGAVSTAVTKEADKKLTAAAPSHVTSTEAIDYEGAKPLEEALDEKTPATNQKVRVQASVQKSATLTAATPPWICAYCDTKNTGNICSGCGAARILTVK